MSDLLTYLREHGTTRMENTVEAEQAWQEHVRAMYDMLLLRNTKSWFTGYNSNVEGRDTIRYPSNVIARMGIAYCPEERGIFSSLNVEENLMLPPAVKPGGMTLAEVYKLFPNLEERRRSQGTKLSGGEQQMLAIGRCLMGLPDLVMFDEPSLGLAPIIVAQIFDFITDYTRQRNTTVIVAEQMAAMALKVAQHGYAVDSATDDEHLGVGVGECSKL